MKPNDIDEVLHIMRNIAQKHKGFEQLHETQKHLINTINSDWDRVMQILRRNGRETDGHTDTKQGELPRQKC